MDVACLTVKRLAAMHRFPACSWGRTMPPGLSLDCWCCWCCCCCWWMNMLSTANTKTSNTFCTYSKVTFEQKRNFMQFRTGTLYNQKIAYSNGKASSPNCLLCQHTDSQIHMLSGCQHETMKNMITERHNIATSRLIAKAINKGEYGGSIIYTDVGSDLKLTEQNLTRAQHTANKTLFLALALPLKHRTCKSIKA